MSQTVFSSQAQKTSDPFLEQAEKEVMAEVKKAKNILASSKVLFTKNMFPESVRETEKDMLRESLRALRSAAVSAEQGIAELKKIGSERKQLSEEKKYAIEHAFRNTVEEMQKKADDALSALQTHIEHKKEE